MSAQSMLREEDDTMTNRPVEEVMKDGNMQIPAPSPCLNSKFMKVEDYMMWVRKEGEDHYEPVDNDGKGVGNEVETDDFIHADCRVITGIGVRAKPGSITTLRVAYRLLNSETAQLGPIKYITDGTEPHHELEVWNAPAEEENDDQVILCGFGARAANGANLTTLRVWTRDILPDGTLAQPIEHRYGKAKDNPLEAQIMVPNPGIIVGVGLRAKDGNVTHLKAWFGHLKLRET